MKTASAYALNTAEHFAKLGSEVAHMKSNLMDVAKDARRAARRGWHTAEEFVDEATLAVKKHPCKAIGITFGLAFGMGVLAGWLGTRR